jgi:hypothetical protein
MGHCGLLSLKGYFYTKRPAPGPIKLNALKCPGGVQLSRTEEDREFESPTVVFQIHFK